MADFGQTALVSSLTDFGQWWASPTLAKPTLANFSVLVFWPNFANPKDVVVMFVVVVVGLDSPGPPDAGPFLCRTPLTRTAQNFAVEFQWCF